MPPACFLIMNLLASYPTQSLPKSCVFIDGENFRHTLIELFKSEFNPKDHLPLKARWEEFFNYLANAVYKSHRIRTYWYVVGNVDFWPYKIPSEPDKLLKVLLKHEPHRKRIMATQESQKAAVIQELTAALNEDKAAMLERFSGWTKIHNAITLRTDALEFRRAGAIRYDLFTGEFGSEKAVDVNLAVDLLELRPLYDIAIIVSGDGDYVPAVQAVKDSAKRAINVSFKTPNGRLLPGGAYRLNLVMDQVLEVPYDWMRYFMGFQQIPPAVPAPTINIVPL